VIVARHFSGGLDHHKMCLLKARLKWTSDVCGRFHAVRDGTGLRSLLGVETPGYDQTSLSGRYSLSLHAAVSPAAFLLAIWIKNTREYLVDIF
jgi:hypothetical protein